MSFASKKTFIPLFLGGASLLGLVIDLSQIQVAETRQPNATAERVAGKRVVFVQKPTVTAAGKGFKIAFEVSASTDVEVAVLGADGKVVRHLAAGVLGGKIPPPEPLKAGLVQEILWDATDDFGKPATGAPFKVRVRAGMSFKL